MHLRNGAYGLIEIKLGGDKLLQAGTETLSKLARLIDSRRSAKPAQNAPDRRGQLCPTGATTASSSAPCRHSGHRIGITPLELASTLSRALSVTLSPLSKAAGKAHAKEREMEPRMHANSRENGVSGWSKTSVPIKSGFKCVV